MARGWVRRRGMSERPWSSQARGLEVRDVSKSYGGVRAVSGVELTVRPGEVHALVGENGAGKSTLIKIIAGVVVPDRGAVALDGVAIPPGDVGAAQRAGVATIHQESTAFPDLSTVDNLFVGREPRVRSLRTLGGVLLDRRRMRQEALDALAALGERVDVDAPLGRLPLASRQMVAIARALAQRSAILILDEPTASLSAPECEALFRVVRALRAQGIGVLYVSHRLAEIFALADRVTVLRDGRVAESRRAGGFTEASLIRSMVGRDVAPHGRPATARAPGRLVLGVRALTRAPAFRDVTLTVRAGEVVALAGLVGAGRSEVARAVFGVDRPTSGDVRVEGVRLKPGSVGRAVDAGIALVPEDRQQLGLVPPMSVHDNIALTALRTLAPYGFRAREAERAVVAHLIDTLGVRSPGTDAPAESLSGGNQQKLAIAKWLAVRPRVLILDEPTRGVDVGAKAEVYELIRALAREGMATLLISSDLPEVLALSDRVLVMREGRISGELAREEATDERILELAIPTGGPSAMDAGVHASPGAAL